MGREMPIAGHMVNGWTLGPWKYVYDRVAGRIAYVGKARKWSRGSEEIDASRVSRTGSWDRRMPGANAEIGVSRTMTAACREADEWLRARIVEAEKQEPSR